MKKVVNISLGQRTKNMLWELAKHFKTRESDLIKMMHKGISSDYEKNRNFKEFCRELGYKNIERSVHHKPLFLEETLIYKLKQDHFQYNLKNQTIFIKYLIYFYYNTFVNPKEFMEQQ